MGKLTINLVVSNALEALEYYENAFDGVRGEIMDFPKRKGCNEATVVVGGITLRLIDHNDALGTYAPKKGETDSMWLSMEVENADESLRKAIQYGGTPLQEPLEFLGTIHAQVRDPYGYTWTLSHVENQVTFEERYEFFEKFHADMVGANYG